MAPSIAAVDLTPRMCGEISWIHAPIAGSPISIEPIILSLAEPGKFLILHFSGAVAKAYCLRTGVSRECSPQCQDFRLTFSIQREACYTDCLALARTGQQEQIAGSQYRTSRRDTTLTPQLSFRPWCSQARSIPARTTRLLWWIPMRKPQLISGISVETFFAAPVKTIWMFLQVRAFSSENPQLSSLRPIFLTFSITRIVTIPSAILPALISAEL